MFSLGMSIGKKQNTLMKAWARVFNAIYIIILHMQCGNLHSKIIYSHNSKQKKSCYWFTCFNFEGLRHREIDMANSYNQYKVESLKSKRYTLQSSYPMHPCKEMVNYHHNFSQKFMLTGNCRFLSLGGTVLTIVLPTQMHFSKVIS